MGRIYSYKELIVYKKAYCLAMEVFKESRNFPKEEKYSLIDQIRRSSRSITSNIGESWSRRRYPKSFINKLTDSLGEEFETEIWLDYSKDCSYLSPEKHNELISGYEEVRRLLISMINNPEKWTS